MELDPLYCNMIDLRREGVSARKAERVEAAEQK